MVHKDIKASASPLQTTPFHEVPFMASTPSNPLLYINTTEQQPDTTHNNPSLSLHPHTMGSTNRQSGYRRLNSLGYDNSNDKISPVVQSETISMIDAVAKTLCGDNTPPGHSDSFHQYHSRRRGSLPPININQRPTSSLQGMPEVDIDRSSSDDNEDNDMDDNSYSNRLFTRKMLPQDHHNFLKPQGFNRGRRNSLMVPLPSKLDSSPLIPPHSRDRSHSLSPRHRPSSRLSPLYLEAKQYEASPAVNVPVKNLRRKSIANLQTPLPQNYERTESSLDLV